MGFTNDYLTEKKNEDLAKCNYYEFTWRNQYSSPRKCTVDRDRNMWLIRMPRGYEWDPKERIDRFIFFYGTISKENVFEICLNELGKERDKAVLKKYNVKLIWKWKVKSIKRAELLDVSEEELLEVLEEALDVFGLNGTIEWNKPELKNEFKSILKQ